MSATSSHASIHAKLSMLRSVLHHGIFWLLDLGLFRSYQESQHVQQWFYLNWLREVPPAAFSVVPANLLASFRLTAVLVGIYANVLRSGGLSTFLIVVPVNFLRSERLTVDAMGVYASMPRSGRP
uniref:Uncharacterized protein n=1 Tax=Arundo donax TaxID=35708 RepID=A0A0A9DW04_ARUDO